MADDDEHEETFESTDAGASHTYPMEAGQIRKGGYIMIKGCACKVKDVSTSKTGKHGHAKCKFAASDIFSGATKEELCPSTHTIDVPFVVKTDYSVMGMEGDYLQLMSDDGEMREDVQIPTATGFNTSDDAKVTDLLKSYVEEMEGGAEIEIYCTVMTAIGKEKVIDARKKDA
jgi:translation initiation factor 5A